MRQIRVASLESQAGCHTPFTLCKSNQPLSTDQISPPGSILPQQGLGHYHETTPFPKMI